jgi:hypothetical protein
MALAEVDNTPSATTCGSRTIRLHRTRLASPADRRSAAGPAATPSFLRRTSLTSASDEELREAVFRSLMGGLREKAYHHQRLKPRFLSPHGPGPAHAPSAEPTPLAGRYLGVLLSPEMLLVLAVAAFTVLVAVIEWRRRDRS